MIQRIQSLFLLAALAFQAFLIATPLAHFILQDGTIIDFYSKGFMTTEASKSVFLSTIALNILSWIVLALTLITIFLFKKRILQMRFCIYDMLLNVGVIILLAFHIQHFKSDSNPDSFAFAISSAVPVVNVILLFLAFRGIRKDELLVKAYERLR